MLSSKPILLALVASCFALLSFESPLRAEEFLGEEPPNYESSNGKGRSSDGRTERRTRSDDYRNDDSDRGSGGDGSEGNIGFSAAFTAGSNVFGGQGTVMYSFNRYAQMDVSYSYLQMNTVHDNGVSYGPEVSGVLKLPNPSLATPFLGTGLGYVKWQRAHDGEVFDTGGAFTFNTFGGVNIALARHFGLQVLRKQTLFLQRPPKSWEDRSSEEEWSRIGTSIGFYASF